MEKSLDFPVVEYAKFFFASDSRRRNMFEIVCWHACAYFVVCDRFLGGEYLRKGQLITCEDDVHNWLVCVL